MRQIHVMRGEKTLVLLDCFIAKVRKSIYVNISLPNTNEEKRNNIYLHLYIYIRVSESLLNDLLVLKTQRQQSRSVHLQVISIK